ncbi:MAG: hypothetical protein V3T83_10655, partial [Acidobacteriota bacterium]
MRSILILSDKSSGSSALQQHLLSLPGVHCVERTRHYERETLYWVKAASLLNLPQVNMMASEVPIAPRKARKDLTRLLQQNIAGYQPPSDDRKLVMQGWRSLSQRFSPIFLEKSPHHLHQWSALQLISQCMKRYPEISFLVIGLVRNPMDTLYSMWSRWRLSPEERQHEWLL